MIGVLTFALAVSAVGTLGSCKDYDEENRVEWQGEHAGLNKELKDWIEQVKACEKTCGNFRQYLVGNTTWTDEKGNPVKVDRLGAFDKSIANINKVLGEFGENETPSMTFKELLSGYATVQSNAQTAMNILGTISKDDFANNMSTIQSLNATITNLTSATGDLARIKGRLDALELLKPGINDARAKFIADSIADAKIDIAVEKLMGTGSDTLTLNGINYALKAAEEGLQDQIDALNDEMKKFDAEMTAMKHNFGQLVTGVLVQGTYNPIFGSLTAPFNVQSNVLAAYYGKAATDGVFPGALSKSNPIYVFDDKDYLTAKDMEMIGAVKAYEFQAGNVLTDGNAGKIYVTVNPTAIDATGVKLILENSLGDEAPVTLSGLSKSSKKLTFGWTRAGVANGFYEADATVSNLNDAKLVVDMNRNDLKEIFNDLTDRKNGIDLMNIANKVYSVVNDVCDANAIKYSWKNKMVDDKNNIVDGSENNVLSQYSIAATAVKPLSFTFMRDVNMTSFWGVDRVKNFINNTIDGVNFEINIGGEITAPEIKAITIPEFTPNKDYIIDFTYDDKIHVDGVEYTYKLGEVFDKKIPVILYDVNDPTKEVGRTEINLKDYINPEDIKVSSKPFDKEIHISFKKDLNDMIKDLYGDLVAPMEEVNGILNNLNDFMDDVNAMIKEINGINQKIEDVKNDLSGQINKYIDALNKRLCKVVNGVNGRLQPLAIAHNDKGFYTLSGVKNLPTPISSPLHIVPTTYTAELVVPAFKKHLAVTNVFKGNASAQDGDAACLNALKAANGNANMNTVVPGTTRDVEFVGQKGYVYEIAYSALDYSGKAVTKKFYVKVAE